MTGATYAAASASPEGGTYYIMWGAILFGAIKAARSLFVYFSITMKAKSIEREVWSAVTNHDFGAEGLGGGFAREGLLFPQTSSTSRV